MSMKSTLGLAFAFDVAMGGLQFPPYSVRVALVEQLAEVLDEFLLLP